MMSSDQRKTANAISGKTARACDSCLSKRARWFCVADDAFLCQACDVSVHSANQLASRHQRVRLGTSSAVSLLSSNKCNEILEDSPPTWHHGFTRKPRTPRNTKRSKKQNLGGVVEEGVNPLPPLVPEIGSDDDNNEIDPEQLFCQVPELLDDDLHALLNDSGGDDDMRGLEIPEFLSSDVDMEMAEFAADVETLLGDEDLSNAFAAEEKPTAVKIEIGDDCTEALNWNFGEEEVEQKVTTMLSGLDDSSSMESGSCKEEVKKTMLLTLNYEEVISAWASQGCPWTDGIRPDFDPNHCWPDFMGDHYHHGHPYGPAMMMRRSDDGREARVTRYREKRRTRLFSKKIRYEVRKLNAEKRPRLKGRFVKRTSFQPPPPPFPNYLLNPQL